MNNETFHIRKVTESGKMVRNRFNGLKGHYLLIIPLKIKTRKEIDSFRNSCKNRTEYCQFNFLGKRCRIYTDGFTEHLKPMIPLIKDKVLEDCIKNPAHYLYWDKKR